jgi:hypothetical protein
MRSGPERRRRVPATGFQLRRGTSIRRSSRLPARGGPGTWTRDRNIAPVHPPEYGSTQFLAEMHEVYDVSQNLTEEQKRIAEYWADGAGTVTPPGHWNAIAIDLVREAGRSTLRTTRLFSVLNTAQADRSDNEVGLRLGRRVGQVAVEAYHVPTP